MATLRLHPRHAVALASACVCAALAWVIYLELDQQMNPPLPGAPAAVEQRIPAARSRESRVVSMRPLATYAEVTARPLFSESRRPATEAAAQSDPDMSFVLKGTVISAHQSHALLESGQPPHLSRVAEGDELDGWTIEAIFADRVVVRRGQTRMEVKPSYAQSRVAQAHAPHARPTPARPIARARPIVPDPSTIEMTARPEAE